MSAQEIYQYIQLYAPRLSTPVALAAIAVLGYLFGRRHSAISEHLTAMARREIERAQQVAQQLERIALAVQKQIEAHHASVARFKEKITELSAEEREETWSKLCREAEEILRPTMQLATEFAHAYDAVRQQTNHLMTFTEVRTDPLTGIRNRRALDETLESMFAMKTRYDHAVSLVIFDIDHFKQINDQHGHLNGDRVLRAVASLLDETVRETDVVARYGGEEFVVLMPQTELSAACLLCERLRKQIESHFAADDQITVSGGVASALDGENAESLLARADQALYDAKQAGRNRVHCHTGDAIEPAEQILVDAAPLA